MIDWVAIPAGPFLAGGDEHPPVAHMGQATAEITISRPGMPTHELQTPAGTPHPLDAAARVIDEISNQNVQPSTRVHERVGAETYFLGEVHGGDFYNRFRTTCRIVGTRRWMPGNSLEAVEAGYRDVLAGVAAATGCGPGTHADVEYRPVGELVRAAAVYVALLRRLLT